MVWYLHSIYYTLPDWKDASSSEALSFVPVAVDFLVNVDNIAFFQVQLSGGWEKTQMKIRNVRFKSHEHVRNDWRSEFFSCWSLPRSMSDKVVDNSAEHYDLLIVRSEVDSLIGRSVVAVAGHRRFALLKERVLMTPHLLIHLWRLHDNPIVVIEVRISIGKWMHAVEVFFCLCLPLCFLIDVRLFTSSWIFRLIWASSRNFSSSCSFRCRIAFRSS